MSFVATMGCYSQIFRAGGCLCEAEVSSLLIGCRELNMADWVILILLGFYYIVEGDFDF